MFTGIVTDIGSVRSAEQRGDLRLTIGTSYDLDTVDLGASISCSGVCLTVVDKGPDWFAVDVSAETISKTAADHWRKGAKLNLERALRLGDELGGHIVTGHVDTVAHVVEARPEGDSMRLTLRVARDFAPMIAQKGSLTLDGVSLTVNGVGEIDQAQISFDVNIISHTAHRTTLGEVKRGQQLNVEIDVLARYIDRMMATIAH